MGLPRLSMFIFSSAGLLRAGIGINNPTCGSGSVPKPSRYRASALSSTRSHRLNLLGINLALAFEITNELFKVCVETCRHV